jgi:ankyrin repeat protein
LLRLLQDEQPKDVVIKWIQQHIVSLNFSDDQGRTPLHLACIVSEDRVDYFDVVKHMIQKGSNVNAKDQSGREETALHSSQHLILNL